ncbi:MAG: PIN domain-containing protein [Burkholderiaceae bacterium]|jgi:predicted nucleic acid-binding protein|nr:PIN domain-containing protein [Burkholderiaceae bacterium]
MTSPLPHTAICVLDTQVLLDWVLFDDPRMRPWALAIQSERVRWIYCAAMQDEALRVVHYPALVKRHDPSVSTQNVAACFARWGQLCRAPQPQSHLVCTDPDDQMFLDLALTQRAANLLSRDRAVLHLAQHASGLGLHISPPERAAAPR